jgi:hypothetical protein
MISISDKEKQFLQSILSASKVSEDVQFNQLVEGYLPNMDVFLDFKAGSVEFRFDQQAYASTSQLAQVAKETSWTFLKFIRLLTYLEKSNYLYLYKEPLIQPNAYYGQLPNKKSHVSFAIYDPEVKNLLLEYSYRSIVVGQALVDFVNNDFKTDHQIRQLETTRLSEQSLKISNESFLETKKGLGLSIESLEESRKGLKISEQSLEESKKSVELSGKALAESNKNLNLSKTALIFIVVLVSLGVIGTIAEVYYTSMAGKETESGAPAAIKLDNAQFQSLDDKLKKLEAVETKLDLLLNQMNTKDTLITKVANFPEKKEKK